jgi:hypothetical protein
MNLGPLINEAVARGWCHPETSHKEMDPDLATAIAGEVMRAMHPVITKMKTLTMVAPPDDDANVVQCPHCLNVVYFKLAKALPPG